MNLLKKEVYFEKNGVCTFYDFANELSYDELLAVNGGCGDGQKVQNSAITLLPPNYEGKGAVASNDIVRSRCGGGIFVKPYPPSLPYSENESAEGFSLGTSGKCGGVVKCPDPLTNPGIRWNFTTWKNAPGRFQLHEQQTELKGEIRPHTKCLPIWGKSI